jgi:hypothetical protein
MSKTALLALFTLALVAYLFLWPEAPVLEGDSPQYVEVAQDLLDGRLDALHDRTPGYPLLIALTGAAYKPTRTLFVVSLLLHFASVWMLVAVLESAAVEKRWVRTLALLLLLPPYVEPAAYVMTENLAQFTIVAGFTSMLIGLRRGRLWPFALAAVAFACGSMTRPIYQALTFVLAACLVVVPVIMRSSRIRFCRRGAAVVVVTTLLILSGYGYANRLKFGFFGVTHTVGFHLTTKTMSFVERLPEEYAAVREILIRERDAQLTKRGGTHTGTQTIWSVRPELSAATGLASPELSRYLLRMNLRLIASNPIEYLQEVARSMASYWFPAAGHLASLNSKVLRWTWGILHALLLTALLVQLVVFAGILLFEASRRRGMLAAGAISWPIHASDIQALAYVLAGAIVFYNMALSCALDIGETRQRRPTDVLVVFLCVLGLHVWHQSALARREPLPHEASLARE